MKVGVVKIGARISIPANSGNGGEALSIIKMLQLGGAEVHIYTKILKKDNLVPDFKWHDIERDDSTSGLDALVVVNGNCQMYGGNEDRAQLLNYTIINNFHGPVFYTLCDPELTLKQVWPSVENKKWAKNWTQSQLEVSRRDIIYLSQPFNTQKVMEYFGKNEVKPSKIIHFPFEKFPLLNPRLPLNENPEVDLSYGGTFRGGRRIDKMMKFYFGHADISVEMFGKIDASDFDPGKIKGSIPIPYPHFTGSVKYDEMLPKMNKSLAHCVLGDPYYSAVLDIPQRASEAVNSSTITFIDVDLDPHQRFYGSNKDLAYFLYVSEKKELEDKIKIVKSDPALRKSLVQAQYDSMNFDPKTYCDSFVNILKDNA